MRYIPVCMLSGILLCTLAYSLVHDNLLLETTQLKNNKNKIKFKKIKLQFYFLHGHDTQKNPNKNNKKFSILIRKCKLSELQEKLFNGDEAWYNFLHIIATSNV